MKEECLICKAPLGKNNFGLSHKMTAKALEAIGEIGGPGCCKRDSYLSVLQAVDFVRENLGISMDQPEICCSYSSKNNQCIGKRCPFRKEKMWHVSAFPESR